MSRARTLTTTAICLVAAALLTGCGGSGYSGPAGDSLSAMGPSAGDQARQIDGGNQLFSRLMGGRADIGSGVAGDTSITDPLAATYASVPGSSSIDSLSALTSNFNDNLLTSQSVDDLSLTDPTITDTAFSSSIDPTSSLGGATFDAALNDAQQTYGGTGGPVDLSSVANVTGDPMLDGVAADAQLETSMNQLDAMSPGLGF